MLEEKAYKYARKNHGRVAKLEDYRFLFEEFDTSKKTIPPEVKRTYWVMESYFVLEDK